MRLAVLSDIHGNLAALEAVLADVRTRGVDAMVNLGDCVTGPLWPRETFELLSTLNMPTVRGNHDRWIVSIERSLLSRTGRFAYDALTPGQRASLGALPASVDLEGVLAVHGTPRSDVEYLLEQGFGTVLALAPRDVLEQRLEGVSAGLVLCGHSHHQYMTCVAEDRMVLNPGSVGCPRSADSEVPLLAEASSPHARYAIATRRARRWSVELIALEYDWSIVTGRARQNGREDWATGFLGG